MIIRIVILTILLIFLLCLVRRNTKSLTKSVFIVFAILLVPAMIKYSLNDYYDYSNLEIKIDEINEKLKTINQSLKETMERKEKIDYYLDKYDYHELESKKEEYIKEKNHLDNIYSEKENVLSLKNNTYNELLLEYDSLIKNKYMLQGFMTYNQFPNYPNGCEAVSLYMILKYYKVNVNIDDLVDKLAKGAAPHLENGMLRGADPELEYVGNPRETNGKGYGVYTGPIIELANKYKKGMKDLTGTSLYEILKIVKTGKPVQVWASVGMKNTRVCISWLTNKNRRVSWMCGLHSLVIIGFTGDKVITSDPYTGKIEYYNRTRFEKMFNQYGKRAVYYEE